MWTSQLQCQKKKARLVKRLTAKKGEGRSRERRKEDKNKDGSWLFDIYQFGSIMKKRHGYKVGITTRI